MNNQNIIIIFLIVVVVAILGVFIFTTTGDNGKINTQINFINEDNLKNGESIEVELKDDQGNVLSGQNVTITYEENGKYENYSLISDGTGKVYLTLDNEPAGAHKVTATYNGTSRFNGCSAEKTINIEESNIAENTQSTPNNSTGSTIEYNNASTPTQTYYDAELNEYYDANGIIIGGQNAGASIYHVRNNPPVVDEEGNLI